MALEPVGIKLEIAGVKDFTQQVAEARKVINGLAEFLSTLDTQPLKPLQLEIKVIGEKKFDTSINKILELNDSGKLVLNVEFNEQTLSSLKNVTEEINLLSSIISNISSDGFKVIENGIRKIGVSSLDIEDTAEKTEELGKKSKDAAVDINVAADAATKSGEKAKKAAVDTEQLSDALSAISNVDAKSIAGITSQLGSLSDFGELGKELSSIAPILRTIASSIGEVDPGQSLISELELISGGIDSLAGDEGKIDEITQSILALSNSIGLLSGVDLSKTTSETKQITDTIDNASGKSKIIDNIKDSIVDLDKKAPDVADSIKEIGDAGNTQVVVKDFKEVSDSLVNIVNILAKIKDSIGSIPDITLVSQLINLNTAVSELANSNKEIEEVSSSLSALERLDASRAAAEVKKVSDATDEISEGPNVLAVLSGAFEGLGTKLDSVSVNIVSAIEKVKDALGTSEETNILTQLSSSAGSLTAISATIADAAQASQNLAEEIKEVASSEEILSSESEVLSQDTLQLASASSEVVQSLTSVSGILTELVTKINDTSKSINDFFTALTGNDITPISEAIGKISEGLASLSGISLNDLAVDFAVIASGAEQFKLAVFEAKSQAEALGDGGTISLVLEVKGITKNKAESFEAVAGSLSDFNDKSDEFDVGKVEGIAAALQKIVELAPSFSSTRDASAALIEFANAIKKVQEVDVSSTVASLEPLQQALSSLGTIEIKDIEIDASKLKIEVPEIDTSSFSGIFDGIKDEVNGSISKVKELISIFETLSDIPEITLGIKLETKSKQKEITGFFDSLADKVLDLQGKIANIERDIEKFDSAINNLGKSRGDDASVIQSSIDGFRRVASIVQSITGEIAGIGTTAVEINTIAAEESLERIISKINELDSRLISGLEFNIDTEQSQQNISGVSSRFSELSGAIDSVASDATDSINNITASIDVLKKKISDVTIPELNATSDTDLSDVADDVKEVTQATAKLDLSEKALDKLGSAFKELKDLISKAVDSIVTAIGDLNQAIAKIKIDVPNIDLSALANLDIKVPEIDLSALANLKIQVPEIDLSGLEALKVEVPEFSDLKSSIEELGGLSANISLLANSIELMSAAFEKAADKGEIVREIIREVKKSSKTAAKTTSDTSKAIDKNTDSTSKNAKEKEKLASEEAKLAKEELQAAIALEKFEVRILSQIQTVNKASDRLENLRVKFKDVKKSGSTEEIENFSSKLSIANKDVRLAEFALDTLGQQFGKTVGSAERFSELLRLNSSNTVKFSETQLTSKDAIERVSFAFDNFGKNILSSEIKLARLQTKIIDNKQSFDSFVKAGSKTDQQLTKLKRTIDIDEIAVGLLKEEINKLKNELVAFGEVDPELIGGDIKKSSSDLAQLGNVAEIVLQQIADLFSEVDLSEESLTSQNVAANRAAFALSEYGKGITQSEIRLAKLRDKIKDNSAALKTFSNDGSKSKEELDKLRRSIDLDTASANNLENTLNATKETFRSLGGNLSDLSQGFDTTTDEIDEQAFAANRAAFALSEYGKGITQSEIRLAKLRDKIKDNSAALNTFSNDGSKSKEQLDKLRRSIDLDTASADNLETKLNATKETFRSLGGNLSDLSEGFNRTTDEIDEQAFAANRARNAWEKYGSQITTTQTQLVSLTSKSQVLRNRLKELTASGKSNTLQFDRVQQELTQVESKTISLSTQLEKQSREFIEAGGSAEQLAKELKNIEEQVKRNASSFSGLGNILRGFGSRVSDLGKRFSELGGKLISSGTLIRSFGRDVTFFVSLPVAGFFKEVVQEAIAFEDAFAGVTKTVDGVITGVSTLTESGEQLRQEIIDLSAEIPITTDELAKIGELGGQLGIGSQNISSFIDTIARLGVATNLSTQEAADSIAQFLSITSDAASSSDEFRIELESTAASVVALGNNLATTEKKILNFALRLAPVANLAGITQQDILGISAAFSSVGIPAERGGTAVQKVIRGIIEAVQVGGQDLQNFANVAGQTSSEFAALFERDAGQAFTRFVEGVGRRSSEASIILNKLDLDNERVFASILAVANAGDRLAQSLALSRGEFIESGNAQQDFNALQIESARRFATTESQVGLLKNQFSALSITIGDAILPKINELIVSLRSVTESIRVFVRQEPGLTKIIGAIGAIVVAAGPITFLFGNILSATGLLTKAIGGLISGLFGLLSGLTLISAPIAAVAALFVALATTFALTFDRIDSILQTRGSSLAKEMLEWGKSIVIFFARGMIQAAVFVVRALNVIAGAISKLLKPKSPPAILPDLEIWGKEAAQIWLNAWGQADFSVFSDIAGTIEGFLRSNTDSKKADRGLIDTIIGTRGQIREAIGQVREFGKLSTNSINNLVRSIGFGEPILEAYVRGMFDLLVVTRQVEEAQRQLTEVNERFADTVAPLNAELKEIRNTRQDADEQKKIAKLEKTISSRFASDKRKELAILELREILIQRQIRQAEELRDAEAEPIKQQLVAAERQKKNIEERTQSIKSLLDLESQEKDLLKGIADAISGLGEKIKPIEFDDIISADSLSRTAGGFSSIGNDLTDAVSQGFDGFEVINKDILSLSESTNETFGSIAGTLTDAFDDITKELSNDVSLLSREVQNLGNVFAPIATTILLQGELFETLKTKVLPLKNVFIGLRDAILLSFGDEIFGILKSFATIFKSIFTIDVLRAIGELLVLFLALAEIILRVTQLFFALIAALSAGTRFLLNDLIAINSLQKGDFEGAVKAAENGLSAFEDFGDALFQIQDSLTTPLTVPEIFADVAQANAAGVDYASAFKSGFSSGLVGDPTDIKRRSIPQSEFEADAIVEDIDPRLLDEDFRNATQASRAVQDAEKINTLSVAQAILPNAIEEGIEIGVERTARGSIKQSRRDELESGFSPESPFADLSILEDFNKFVDDKTNFPAGPGVSFVLQKAITDGIEGVADDVDSKRNRKIISEPLGSLVSRGITDGIDNFKRDTQVPSELSEAIEDGWNVGVQKALLKIDNDKDSNAKQFATRFTDTLSEASKKIVSGEISPREGLNLIEGVLTDQGIQKEPEQVAELQDETEDVLDKTVDLPTDKVDVRSIAAFSVQIDETSKSLAGYFSQAVRAEKTTLDTNRALFDAADAAGADAVQLALLANATNTFTDSQIIAALKLAILKEGINQIATAYANGNITLGEAIQLTKDFVAEVDETFKIVVDTGDVEEATDLVGDLTDDLNELAKERTATIRIQVLGQQAREELDQFEQDANNASNAAGQAPGGVGNDDGDPTNRGDGNQSKRHGGYTGTGRDNEIAGTVHRNEYVLPSGITKALGIGTLERLRKSGNIQNFVNSIINRTGARSKPGSSIIRDATSGITNATSGIASLIGRNSITSSINRFSELTRTFERLTNPVSAPQVANTSNRTVNINMTQNLQNQTPNDVFLDVVAALSSARLT